nr:lengsin-like [Lytechinus pictus]
MSLEQVEGALTLIEDHNLTAIRFEQTDMHGIARCKTIPACHFKEKATKGVNFVLLALGALDVKGELVELVEDTGYGEDVSFGDAVAFPDFDTLYPLPWLKSTGRILVEPTYNGESVPGHPRVIAKRQLEKLKEMGMSLLSAHEHEFYLVEKETLKPMNGDDSNIFATIRNTPILDLIDKFIEYLPQVGVSVESVENEMGPGQVEISYKPAFGLRAADNAHTYKTSIKEIALLNGCVASFMSKPYPEQAGSSSHFCHSLWDVEGKLSLLYNHDDPTHLSEIGQQWTAGILAHARATEILMAPTVNCLKRVKPMATPINVTWGLDNRTCLVRVKINGDTGTYLENRAGASGCNPYLSLAATVAAGIDGIVNKMKLPPPVTRNAYKPENIPPKTASIPDNMEDALKALLDDEVICDALGKEFIKSFSALKRYEANQEREARDKGDEHWDFNKFFYYL